MVRKIAWRVSVATVFATAGFAAVSGASTATAAVFARVAIPEMLRTVIIENLQQE